MRAIRAPPLAALRKPKRPPWPVPCGPPSSLLGWREVLRWQLPDGFREGPVPAADTGDQVFITMAKDPAGERETLRADAQNPAHG